MRLCTVVWRMLHFLLLSLDASENCDRVCSFVQFLFCLEVCICIAMLRNHRDLESVFHWFFPQLHHPVYFGVRGKFFVYFSICLFLCHTQFLRYTFIHLFILKSNQKLLLGCHDNVSFVPLCLIQHPPLTPTTGKVISISICNSKK